MHRLRRVSLAVPAAALLGTSASWLFLDRNFWWGIGLGLLFLVILTPIENRLMRFLPPAPPSMADQERADTARRARR